MRHLTYTVGAGGNFIACLLCHSKYKIQIPEVMYNEYGCESQFEHGVFSHYATINPTIMLHEPNKEYLHRKQTILLYKRIKSGKNIFIDTRLSVQSLIHNGNFEFQIDRQNIVKKSLTDIVYIFTWHDLFYNINKEQWYQLFDFFKCDFYDEYLFKIEDYTKRNDAIFNSDETIRIREFLTKYT